MNSERHRGSLRYPHFLVFPIFFHFLFYFSLDGGVLLPVEFLNVDTCLITASSLVFLLSFDVVFIFYFFFLPHLARGILVNLWFHFVFHLRFSYIFSFSFLASSRC